VPNFLGGLVQAGTCVQLNQDCHFPAQLTVRVRQSIARYLGMIGIAPLLNNLLMYLLVVLFGLPACQHGRQI
jgi:hypothetical protein